MKKMIISSILAVLLATGSTIVAQNRQDDYLGLPGDNLNLYGVMKLFQESKTLEGFENSLNDRNSNLNNLDLNGDNYVDYIRVFDNIDGNVHNIVLQVSINERENQDVAVFTVQRFNNGQVIIQLTGDEELYGKDYIIEPIFDDSNEGQTPNPGYTGRDNNRNITVVRTTTYELASWPVVSYIYLPTYSPWRSSWYWGYYPSYWNPWEPYYYHYYYGYHYNWYNNYYGHYRRWHTHRYDRWNDYYYTSHRAYSPFVSVRIKSGNYKNTYSRPEQRRDGEAMFAKTHPEQSRRQSAGSSDNKVSRTNPQSGQKNSGTVTTRRSSTNVNNKSVTNPSSGQKAGTTRRSATVNNKSVTKSQSGQSTGNARRSGTVSEKSVNKSPAAQNAGNITRSRSRSEGSSQSNTVSSRTSGQSKSSGVSSSNRRSSNASKSGTTVKQSEKAKETDVKKNTRR